MSVRADQLDNVLEAMNCRADFIKLDVQGAELQVLHGAERTLRAATFGLEVEVEFAELYLGQPHFSQVDDYLRGLGFTLFDLNRFWWKRCGGERTANRRGQLIFGEALYLKDYVARPEQIFGRSEKDPRSYILRAMAISAVYEKFDYGLELVRLALDRGVLSEEEVRQAESVWCASRTVAARLPHFRGRGRLATWLRGLAARIEPQTWGASDGW
jgi:hypothetical protein